MADPLPLLLVLDRISKVDPEPFHECIDRFWAVKIDEVLDRLLSNLLLLMLVLSLLLV